MSQIRTNSAIKVITYSSAEMDAGRFESSPRPFPLHRAIQSVLGPIGIATSAKNLRLVTELDERIDLLTPPLATSEGLWVLGDEIRLRQVLTNLASNAVKFTPEDGGDIKIVTRLIDPLPTSSTGAEVPITPDSAGNPHGLSPLSHNNLDNSNNNIGLDGVKRSAITFRLEVHDSGPGSKFLIRPQLSRMLIKPRVF